MYCQKCGTELPDGSNFCTNCGYSFKGDLQPKDSKSSSEIIYKLKSFLICTFKSPVKCCMDFSDKFSNKLLYSYLSITTVLISLICSLYLKFFVKSTLIFFAKLSASNSGYMLSSSDLSESSPYINAILNSIFPFFKTFLTFIFGFILFFGLLILMSYLVNNIIFKNNISLKKYLVITAVGLTLESVTLIVSMLLFALSFLLGIIFLSIANVIIIVVLYSGLSKLKEEKAYDPYIFAIIYTIASLLTSYLMILFIANNIIALLNTSVFNLIN